MRPARVFGPRLAHGKGRRVIARVICASNWGDEGEWDHIPSVSCTFSAPLEPTPWTRMAHMPLLVVGASTGAFNFTLVQTAVVARMLLDVAAELESVSLVISAQPRVAG